MDLDAETTWSDLRCGLDERDETEEVTDEMWAWLTWRCETCGRHHDIPTITYPHPPVTPLRWRNWRCILGLHRWEERQACPYRDGYYEGAVVVTENMKQRRQCGRCGILE